MLEAVFGRQHLLIITNSSSDGLKIDFCICIFESGVGT